MSKLADFSFTIKYRPGHLNKDADALSRMTVDIASYELCTECLLPADIMAVFVGLRAKQHGETTCVSGASLDDSLLDFDNVSVVTGGSQIKQNYTVECPKTRSRHWKGSEVHGKWKVAFTMGEEKRIASNKSITATAL